MRMRSAARVMRQLVYVWEGGTPRQDEIASLTFELINHSNVQRTLEFRGPTQLTLFERFIDEGRVGLFAIGNGRPVGHAWSSTPALKRTSVNGYFRVDPGDVLIHHCYVAEASRGAGIYTRMLKRIVQELSADNRVDRIYIDTERKNAPSARGILKAGFRFRSRATFVIVLRHLVLRIQ